MKLEKDSRNSLDFELFFKIHYSRFYSYALHVIGNEEEARDIVSDYFEFIWKHRASNIGNWETYAYSYIRNKCIDSLRHQDVTRKYVDFYIKLIDVNAFLDIFDKILVYIINIYKFSVNTTRKIFWKLWWLYTLFFRET